MAQERDPRIAKAFRAMRSLGIDAETVKPVLKRLLKLYNRNWELIEEDNFRTLADAIFEHSDEKAKAEKNSNTVNEDVEPPFKKPHRGLPEDQVSSTGGNGKSIVDIEDGEVPKSSNEIMMVESSQSVSGDPTQCCVSEAPSGSKCKNPIRVNSALDEENSSTRAALGASYSNQEPNNSVLDPMIRDMSLDRENRNAKGLRENQHVDRSPQFAAPASRICPGSTNTSDHSEKRKKKLESSSSYDHQTMFQTAYDIASSTCGQLLNELCESYLETNRSSGNYIHSSLRCSTQKDHPEGDQGKRISSGSGSSASRGPVIARLSDKKKVFHKVSDITNGTEKVKISLLDEKGNEDLPHYIYSPENITYESAYVHVSLARISDEDCCSGCMGDCLSSSIPCTCARDTGGEFAYTPEGLLNEKFLKSCISMKLSPKNHHLFYCQDCPLERAKNVDMPENCKGHMLRKFIKECWRKCGCNMQCGNRVVQRGITRKLQVFLTSEGKGWGLRTLEELPKGSFICEYVGEILTNIELYERNKKSRGDDKHVYPVLLDADWATEGVLKDEDALCLDATHYGNVARFINHRCFDGNLLEIPVQVETPDRHYYHLAFFTTRKVEALEELTWDYGIDFDDKTHPVKAFQCHCGSPYCRDRKVKKNSF
ncbi:Histone-lysine N-methyltransferase SUVR4 [Sesamum alatum]|uniref:Histone-lysine N-methyltransferase SUVR4 n=1 Tax=Sesamum alatum TaxID=300844 RepID=A0AAE2CT36_9LAMI|nr:Histone-lysine N-methyltransferase SUVR4 [Sesamum alatum]